MKLLVLHGPNLNLLGAREPEHYGRMTLEDINGLIAEFGRTHGVTIDIFNSNHEGALIERIHNAMGSVDGMVFNPGAFTHTSVALRDAVLASGIPTVEVHLSNIHAREQFRHQSLLSDIVVGVVAGFREYSYILGLQAIMHHLRSRSAADSAT